MIIDNLIPDNFITDALFNKEELVFDEVAIKPKIRRLKKIDRALYELKRLYSLTDLYPTNVEEEKKRFFTSKSYDPVFKYRKRKINFKKVYKQLESLKFQNEVMDRILKEKAEEIYNHLKMLEYRGTTNFSKYSIKIHGKPSKGLIQESKRIIKKYERIKKVKKVKVSPDIAVKRFNDIFTNLHLDWTAKEGEIASNAVVLPQQKTLMIKKGRKLSERDIKRFIVHEIYTHVLRAEFGLRQPYKVFAMGLANYEATEEGLALFKEKRARVQDKSTIKGYAIRVLAVDKALRSSFRETFNFLRTLTDEENAWNLTLRVKRGLGHTKQKGAFTKDYSYLHGYYEVTNFIKNQSGLHLLHYGKINTKQALLIPSIEGLKNPFVVLKDQFKPHIHEISILY